MRAPPTSPILFQFAQDSHATQEQDGKQELAQDANTSGNNIMPTTETYPATFPDKPQGIRESNQTTVRLRAFDRMHRALAEPRAYRITPTDRNPLTARTPRDRTHNLGRRGGKEEHLWTPDEVRTMIADGTLNRLNAHAYDIYITPVDDRCHYIVIDDLDGVRGIEALRAAGYVPVLVQETSRNSRQAVLLVEHSVDADPDCDRRAANAVAAGINKRFGDPRVARSGQPFRLGGFRNTKPTRNGEYTVIDWGGCAPGHVCEKATAERNSHLSRLAAAARGENGGQEAGTREGRGGSGDPVAMFARRTRGYITIFSRTGTVDPSTVDYRAARDLLCAGYSEAQVEDAMRLASPGIGARHGDDLGGYIRRTIAAALRNHAPTSGHVSDWGAPRMR